MDSRIGKCLFTVACAGIAVLVSTAAPAAESCPNGQVRTAHGHCVESDLAAAMRQRAIEASQPKISETAGANSPSQDHSTPKAGDLNRYELSTKGNFSTNPTPPSK